MWHDNSGLRDMQPWYLSYMVLQDLQTGLRTRFLADRWLAIDRGDLCSSITVHSSQMEAPIGIGFLIKTGLFNKLRDDHVFWSVFSRPVRSRFTRVQRTCVSMAAFVLVMLTNAMW